MIPNYNFVLHVLCKIDGLINKSETRAQHNILKNSPFLGLVLQLPVHTDLGSEA
jgi:hypothetical protein